jgi:O-antigen/teichoic acid export membrane protein
MVNGKLMNSSTYNSGKYSGFIGKIVKNFAWLLVQLGVTRLFGFFITIILARYLSQADFGRYTYTVSITGIFLMLANLGIPSLMLREIARQREQASSIFSRGFAAKLPLTVVAFSAFIMFFLVTSSHAGRLAVIAIAVAYFVENFATFFAAPFKAVEQMQYVAFGDFFYRALMIALVWSMMAFRPTLMLVGVVYVICGVAHVLYYCILYKIKFDFKLIARNVTGVISNFVGILKDALPMALGGVIMVVYINADIVILKWLKGETVTGVYGVSYSFYLGLAIMASLLVQSVFPRLSYAAENGQIEVKGVVMRGTVKLLFVISVPIAVGGILLADDAITFFYGARYLDSAMAFRIFMATVVLNYFNLLLGYCLFAERKQSETNVIYAISFVINITGNLLLIPKYSIAGAALATLLAEAVFTVIYIFRHPDVLRNFKIGWVWRIVLASTVMGFAVQWVDRYLGFLPSVACGAAIYGCILLVTGTFVNEKGLLKDIFTKAGMQ